MDIFVQKKFLLLRSSLTDQNLKDKLFCKNFLEIIAFLYVFIVFYYFIRIGQPFK